jgi:class 3 adenylate cyclase
MSSGGVETVTILITDLVGSTELESRVGPVVAEELRQEHFGLLRDAVGDAGGREVKNTGDGLMVAFDSAAAAVSCAILIQQHVERRNRSAVEPLPIKAGVSAGDASIGEDDIFGMPVIEAARLCERCSAGQILANELVAHLAAGRGHAFVSLGALELKGLPEPLSAVEVAWEPVLAAGIALPQRLRELPATAYVGRVAERGRLTELWADAREGSLRLALIGGEAGVGKTRLGTHLAHEVHGTGATVLYGRCDEELGVPYQPWAQGLGHLVKEAAKRVLDAHVARFGGDLARLVPALRDRVPDLPSSRATDPETERYLLYAAVAGLLEGTGEREPLLVILDDLHWADQPTLSLLRHVVTAGVSMRVLVVGAYRDSELSQDHPLARLLADLHREPGCSA